MRREEAEAIALAGGELARGLVVELLKTVSELRDRVSELEARLNQDSSNSSKPPSSDPPMSRAQRRALARERRVSSARNSGGQPGHEGKNRKLVPQERVSKTFEHFPKACCGCGQSFNGSEESVGKPVIFQKWELPRIDPLVYEHRLLRVACPNCGKGQLADLPVGVTPLAFGPRIEAHIAMLAGEYRLSRRQIAKVVKEMFGVPISTGAVDKVIMRVSSQLKDPWDQLKEAISSAQVVHADETGWPVKGNQQWLWLAASSLVACYRIDPSRGQRAAKELLGQDFGQIAVTDRYRGYLWLDDLHRQLCWAHIIRQFVSLSERGGAPGRLGAKLAKAADEVFALNRIYLEKNKSPDWLRKKLKPHRERIYQLLEQGSRSRNKKTQRFCIDLLGDWDSLWLFSQMSEVPITNNQAERGLRHAVIMRKVQLGTQSHKGSRWIERICSVKESCRLQQRSVLDYLIEVTSAAHSGQTIPSLVPP